MVGRMPERPLRVLFFVREAPYVRRIYQSFVAELAERGHEVELSFGERTPVRQVESAIACFPERVSHSFAPERDRSDGWRSVAWLVRAIGDLARYTHPRYDQASRLRHRVAQKVCSTGSTHGRNLEPVGRALAGWCCAAAGLDEDADLLDSVIRAASRLEEAIPTSASIDRFIRDRAPDVVLVTPVVKYASAAGRVPEERATARHPGRPCAWRAGTT